MATDSKPRGISSNVINVFKETNGSIQIDAGARVEARRLVFEFERSVADRAKAIASHNRRKTCVLVDAVNGTVAELKSQYTWIDVPAFLGKVFNTGAPLANLDTYQRDDLPTTDSFFESREVGDKAQKRVLTNNALSKGEVEDLFKMERNAAKVANIFMMRAADQLAQELLCRARDASSSKKRIMSTHFSGLGSVASAATTTEPSAPDPEPESDSVSEPEPVPVVATQKKRAPKAKPSTPKVEKTTTAGKTKRSK